MRPRSSWSARSTCSSASTTSCPCDIARRWASRPCARAPSGSRTFWRHGSGFVLYALIDSVVDRYFPILDSLETQLEAVEEQIFVRNAARSNIESLYALKRKLMTLKHVVDPLMEAVGKLYGGRVPQICAGMGEYFRDVFDHLQRLHLDDRGHSRHADHGDPGQPRHDLT